MWGALTFTTRFGQPLPLYEAIGRHFGVTRARVSQLIGLVEHLPKDFIDQLATSTDQDLIKTFPYHVLFRISKLPLKEQREMIRQLLIQNIESL